MGHPIRKRLITGIRIAACCVALWAATRGVPLNDRVVIASDDLPVVRQIATEGRVPWASASLPVPCAFETRANKFAHGTQSNPTQHFTCVGAVVTGTIVADGDPVVVQLANGGAVSIPRRDVAVDAHGAIRIEYGLATAWRRASGPLLLLSVAVFLLVPLLQGQRLQWLLRAEDTQISLWTSVKVSFAGNFLNFAAPLGSTAGDVAKAYYVSQHTDRKTEAATIVFVDRAIGLASLLATVGVIAALSPTGSRLAVLRPYMFVVASLAALAGTAYLCTPLRRFLLPRWLIARLPWIDQLRRIDRTTRSLASRKALVAGAVVNTLVLQMLAAAAFFSVAMALGMRGGPETAVQYYAYFSTGEMVKALPGPPQGLGTAELAYQYLFAALGNPSQIVCSAFAIRLVMLLCSLPGLAVALTGACRPPHPSRDGSTFLSTNQPALAMQTT